MKTVFVLFLIGVFTLGATCSKNDAKIDFSNIDNLHAQPLSVIQQCVQGKWEVKYIYGGIAGGIPISNKFIEVEENHIDDREFQWKEYTIRDYNTSFKTYAVQYMGFDEPRLYFNHIKNDSLYVGYIGEMGCYDCPSGELWVRTK